MKRETRPFIVEVRRGSKKQATPFLPPPPDGPHGEAAPLQRAEEILFSRDPAPNASKDVGARTGRILESVAEPAAEPAEPESVAEPARRRGRPPGSKNKLAEEKAPAAERAPRGRPRVAPQVRHLQLTPELVNAAMQTIEKLEDDQTKPASGAARDASDLSPSPEAAAGAKGPRARPRPAARRLEASPATALEPDELEETDAPGATARVRAPRRVSLGASALDRLLRGGLEARDLRRLFKAEERWKGRMRLRALARRRRGA